jgi:flavin-binding protein dodecin
LIGWAKQRVPTNASPHIRGHALLCSSCATKLSHIENCAVKNLYKSTVLLLAIALWTVSLISHETYAQNTIVRARKTAPRFTEAEVVEIATKVAAKKGYDLKDYEMLDISFSAKNKYWFVHFSGKSRIIGDHFSVGVDDRKRTMKFYVGM